VTTLASWKEVVTRGNDIAGRGWTNTRSESEMQQKDGKNAQTASPTQVTLQAQAQAQAQHRLLLSSSSHRPLATHVPKPDLFQVKGILNYTGGGHSHAKNVLFCGEVVWCRDSIYLH